MALVDLMAALEHSAEEDAAKMLAAAGAEAEQIRRSGRAAASAQLEEALEVERLRLKKDLERRVFQARRAARARVLAARASLVERIFRTAASRAGNVRSWPAYRAALGRDVQRILGFVGTDPGTLRCALPDVERVAPLVVGSALTVKGAADISAGLRLEGDGGRLQIDLTLPAQLDRARRTLAMAILAGLEGSG